MKAKQFLCLLAIVPFIFLSCDKDDNDNRDYRDEFVGTYITNMVGSITLVEAAVVFPMDFTGNFVVKKSGSRQLAITFQGETTIVTVDENGDFAIPSQFASQTQTDPDTGVRVTIEATSSGYGTITGTTLYMKETISGDATLKINDATEYSNVIGSVVYNGNKR